MAGDFRDAAGGRERVNVELPIDMVPTFEVRAGGGNPVLAAAEIGAALVGDMSSLQQRLEAKARAVETLKRVVEQRLASWPPPQKPVP